jgi:hypothetical protein
MINGVTAKQNPFPGLRPFREDEERFFFGRESQVDTMVNKLAATRFLAVVGTSGSGKSSLVNCGLRPALHRGLMASAGPAWRMAQFRPDVNPIQSLAGALAANGLLCSGYKEDVPIEEIVETYLHQSEKGVVKTFRKARLPEGTNLLVVVDQFEELFRYRKLGTPDREEQSTISEAAIAFVNLLLEASAEPDCPIYVVITMRSDFLGDCSQFYGLPEAINQGQYLVPRMTRDERRASIAGPVSVGGAEINPVLLTRLVNDVGDNPDQLSILQHALNRTWACWQSQGAEGELELKHYIEIGTMAEALNQHANKAFELLETPQRRKICEKLFKALTDVGTDPRGIRRPLKLGSLNEIAGAASEEEVKAVIEVFRQPSRSFLMPPATEPLKPEKVIDISHESLMRVWERLQDWAEDEADSARRYRRLAETAALEKTGKAGLWRDPDLQLALDWQEEQAPTPGWANLYGGDFESAMAFLEKSRSERDHEQAEGVFNRRWSRIRLLIVIIMLPIAVIVGIYLWRFAKWSLEEWGFLNLSVKDIPPLVLGAISMAFFFTPYFLGYFASAYSGKWIFRRLAFAKILLEVALSSKKAVREQKLAREAGRRSGLPWEHRQRRGLFKAFVGTLVMVLTKPGEAFTVMKREGGMGKPLIYALIGGCVGGLVSHLFQLSLQYGGLFSRPPDRATTAFFIILLPVFVVIGSFIGSAIVHVCLMIIGGANQSFETTFRVLAFSQGSTGPLQMIPLFGGLIAGIWALVCNCIGLARAHETGTGRAVLAVFLPLIVWCGGAVLIGFMAGAGGASQH